MEQRIRVGAVSYLNTKPLLYGLQRLPVSHDIDLVTAYPATIASQLIEGTIDLGLVPVAILPKLNDPHIIGDYCIGATGPVATVCIFSDLPLEQCSTLLLDYQSRTSVNLARILLKYHWKLDLTLLEAAPGYQEAIGGTTAGVVIGDRAFEQRRTSAYCYDLAEAWQQMTGLPFVFAAWISNKPLPEAFIDDFNAANHYGLHRLEEVVAMEDSPYYDLMTYYTKNISYRLTDDKRKGMQYFLKLLATL